MTFADHGEPSARARASANSRASAGMTPSTRDDKGLAMMCAEVMAADLGSAEVETAEAVAAHLRACPPIAA
jgi:hypothetical protein